ncbi:unnamed protein product [Mytilus edulis]|uniref:Uncharacterized protein n=1 Tax=Mytilus edulis TaxID=6550 RepID=A0A8S3S7D3_MYTED|nr:unnamed protein product [Mytilus edulis]
MVILQQEFVKIGSNQEPSALIYPLLSAVKQGCTREDLFKAMSAAKEDVEQMNRQRQEEDETKDSDEIIQGQEEETKDSDEAVIEDVEESDEIITRKFIQEIVTAGTKENNVEILIKALESLWDTFLTSISSSVSDYLSVEHLGMILNRLKEQGKCSVEHLKG